MCVCFAASFFFIGCVCGQTPPWPKQQHDDDDMYIVSLATIYATCYYYLAATLHNVGTNVLSHDICGRAPKTIDKLWLYQYTHTRKRAKTRLFCFNIRNCFIMSGQHEHTKQKLPDGVLEPYLTHTHNAEHLGAHCSCNTWRKTKQA